MIRYLQDRFDGPWTPIADGPDVFERARAKGAVKLTVLAVSEEVNPDDPNQELKYKGPLYFDIDCEGDLPQAIRSAQELVKKLKENDVPEEFMEVYLSGSKGVHVFVPASLFTGNSRGRKDLPRVYCEVAFDLAVPGMDYQVYSGGRGRTFALPNALRPDGKYRVPVTVAELFQLDEGLYRQWVQTPRELQFPEPGPEVKAPLLSLVFEKAAKRAKRRVLAEERALEAQVEPNQLTEHFTSQGEHPNCVRDLAAGKRRADANFNNSAMQMGIYIARSGSDPDALIASMADNTKSSHYQGAGEKRAHILSMFRYFKRRTSANFSCAAMKSVVSGNPCEGCPIEENRKEGGGEEDKSKFGLSAYPAGYFVEGEKSDRQISTFTLQPMEAIVIEEVIGDRVLRRRVSCSFELFASNRRYVVELPESCWSSKATFLDSISGISDLAFLGTDNDLQKLKHHLLGETEEMGVVIKVDKAGVHAAPHPLHSEKKAFVYVEQDFSFFGLTKAKGTHQLENNAAALPKLRDFQVPKSEGEILAVDSAMSALLRINKPEVVARMVGWMAACHLKTHFIQLWQAFPLLSLWGAAGTGKTTTAAWIASLHGVDYLLSDTPPTASSITKWALHDTCSSTTTVVRILDEFNESKLTRRDYAMVTETLKAAWANQTVLRGTLGGKGARKGSGPVTEYRQISSPLMVISEQSVESVALSHRMLSVQLTTAGRVDGEPYLEMLRDSHEWLYRVGRAMMLQAVTTDLDWLKQAMDDAEDEVPHSMKNQARPFYSHKVIEVGLRFLSNVMKNLGMKEAPAVLEEVLHDYRLWLGRTASASAQSMDWSEVDTVLNTMSMMAAQIDPKNSAGWLNYGEDFVIVGDSIYMDLALGHLKYRGFAARHGEVVAIRDARQLHRLIRDEPYFEAENVFVPSATPGWTGGQKPMWKLNIHKMETKGVNASYLKGQMTA